MTQPKPTDDELHVLSARLVTHASRLVRAVSRRGNHDIPAATLRLLSQLEELEPATVGRLAVADRCSQPTMSSAVKNLLDKGWAAKGPHPDDARSSIVTLTPEGRAVLAEARRHNGAVVAERLEADGRHDVDDLRTAVTLLAHLLEHDQGAS